MDARSQAYAKLRARKMSVYHHAPNAASASFPNCVFNLMNAFVGSGILSLAYAMSQLGICLFFVIMIVVAGVSLYAIHLLLDMCEQTEVKAYEKLGFEGFGMRGRLVAATCILLQNIGSMCSHLYIVKHELPNILIAMWGLEHDDGSWYFNGDYLLILSTIGIVLPLALLKRIEFLGHTSFFSITCMLFAAGVIVGKKFIVDCPLVDQTMFDQPPDNATSADVLQSTAGHLINDVISATVMDKSHHGEPLPDDESIEEGGHGSPQELFDMYGKQTCIPQAFAPTKYWVYSLPTITFAFVCHTAVLPIYAELKNPTPERMQTIATIAIGIGLVVYTFSATFGYLTFFNWNEPEILVMYNFVDPHDLVSLVARRTVMVAHILTVPIIHYPARKALNFILFPLEDFSWIRHGGITIFLLTLVNVLVVYVPSIRDLFGLIGGTASIMLIFVLPGIFFVRIDDRPLLSLKKVSAVIMSTLGILLMIGSLVTIIFSYVECL